MTHFEFELKTQDRLKLKGQGWEPEAGTKAVVCLIHGLGEHSERYRPMADVLNRSGYAVITFDLRGHGRSAGRRGHAPNYALLMSDIDLLLNETTSRFPSLPFMLYGHSLGGNLAIHYALKQRPAIAGVVASAPLFRLAAHPSGRKISLLKTLSRMHLNFTISSELEEVALSRDFHVVRLYQNDPLIHDRITPALATHMLHEGEWNLQHAADFPLPLLLMHGEADRITSVEASIEFASHLEHKCTLKIWDGLYHELHNEPEKDQVFEYVLAWMDHLINETSAL